MQYEFCERSDHSLVQKICGIASSNVLDSKSCYLEDSRVCVAMKVCTAFEKKNEWLLTLVGVHMFL